LPAQTSGENAHFPGRLQVAPGFGDDDPLFIGGQRFGSLPAFAECLAEQLPGG
jgi:hypothetical protein